LKQGSFSVEEYYKEMEKAMIRAIVYEDEEQTIARFMAGLHHNIQRIVEFQPYRHLIDLVHQACKAERQLQQDMKSNRGAFSTKGGTPSGSKVTPRANATRGAITNSSSGLRSSAHGASSGKELAANLQCHHLHQWLLQQKLVEFSVSSVEVVVMLQESVQTIAPSL